LAYRSCTGTDGPGYTTVPPAIAAMQPGDMVMIRGGVYVTPIVIQKSGTAAAHLQISGAIGETVIIDIGATPGAINGVDIQSQQYVDVSHLIIRNAPYFGFKGDGSNHLTLTDSEIAFSGDGGIVFTSASNIIVSGCSVHHNNQKGDSSKMEAISLQMVDTFQVTNCLIFDNAKEGIDSKYGSVNGTISENQLYGNHGPHIYLDGTSFVAVFNNICHDATSSSKAGIGVSVESTYNTVQAPSHDLQIYNNLIYGNGAGIWFWLESPGLPWATISNVSIEYNTIADNNTNNWGGIYVIDGTLSNFGKGNVVRNNIFWNNATRAGAGSIRDDAHVIESFAVDHNLYQQSEPTATYGAFPVISLVTPFVNEPTRDYHLFNVSPAREIGVSVPGVTEDLDGKARPATLTDLGAFQY
jgi:hypothetical protein